MSVPTGLTASKKAKLDGAYWTSLRCNARSILEGRTLVVDPSSGGSSSLPAVCIIHTGGQITEPLEVPVSARYRTRGAYVGHRIQEIGTWLSRELPGEFDLLATELIYEQPSSSTVMRSYYNLVMSVGAIHATVRAKYRLVIPAWLWRANAPAGYVKSDLGDVRLMAETLVRDARTLIEKGRS